MLMIKCRQWHSYKNMFWKKLSFSNKFGLVVLLIPIFQFVILAIVWNGYSVQLSTLAVPLLIWYIIVSTIIMNTFNVDENFLTTRIGEYGVPYLTLIGIILSSLLFLILFFFVGKFIGQVVESVTKKIKYGRANHIS